MKNVKVIGILLGIIVTAAAIYTAINMGEKSPVIVSGQWKLEPSLQNQPIYSKTLFLILYDANSPMPMPYGAVKESLSQPPKPGEAYPFFITKEKIQTMRPNAPLPEVLRLKIRLDLDGLAGRDQPGDFSGEIKKIDKGTRGVTITLAKPNFSHTKSPSSWKHP